MTSEAFSARVVPMIGTLYRVSYSLLREPCDREDAVQEALRKAWQKRDRLRDERYMQTWLVRILINECHNLRSRARRETPVEFLPEREAPPADGEGLREALLGLEEKLRLPIVLHYMEGYSVAEIAKALRLPQGTVKSRMAKAREQLREYLSEGAER